MIQNRLLTEADYSFFRELMMESHIWMQVECTPDQLEEYLLSYKMYNGYWLVWTLENEKVGISFHIEWSPANEKPWLGTILIHKKFRRRGLAKEVINQISDELKRGGNKALFAGCPLAQLEWLKFLGASGFEQLKIEKDSNGSDYMILVKPV
jgi:GNAT superfamily N-acetyltransferase